MDSILHSLTSLPPYSIGTIQTAKTATWKGRIVQFLDAVTYPFSLIASLVFRILEKFATTLSRFFGKEARPEMNEAGQPAKPCLKELSPSLPCELIQPVPSNAIPIPKLSASESQETIEIKPGEERKQIFPVFSKGDLVPNSLANGSRKIIEINLAKPVEEEKQPLSAQESNSRLSSRVKEATTRILLTKGFVADVGDKRTMYGYKGEIQGTAALRKVTAKETKQHLYALSLEALNSQKNVDFMQYLVFKLKRFGHACHLDGIVEMPNLTQINLEGFSEAFTIPMIASSFDQFDKWDSYFDKKSHQWVVENMNATTSSDYMSQEKIEEYVRQIQDKNFMGPLSIGAGYDWHATGAIFFGDYLVYCNCGAGSEGTPGIQLYYLPNRELVTAEVMKKLTKRQNVSQEESFDRQDIILKLKGQLIHHEALPAQTTGNCTYVNMQVTLFSLMAIKHLLNNYGNDICCLQADRRAEIWRQAFKDTRPLFDAWVKFDQKMVLEDFVEEAEELSKDQKMDLLVAKTFDQALFQWQKNQLSHPLLKHPLAEKIQAIRGQLKRREAVHSRS